MNLCSDVMCTSGNFWMVNLGHWSVSSVSIDSQGMLFPNVLSPEERKPCDNGQMLHYTYSQLDIVWLNIRIVVGVIFVYYMFSEKLS